MVRVAIPEGGADFFFCIPLNMAPANVFKDVFPSGF